MLTLADVALELRVCLRTVKKWAAAGVLRVVRLPGRVVRVEQSALDELKRGRSTR